MKKFVDNSASTNNKVLGVYNINDEVLTGENEKKFNKLLKEKLPKYDLNCFRLWTRFYLKSEC